MWVWYTAHLQRRPMLTQALMSGTLLAMGDLLSQQLVERRGRHHQWSRTLRLGLYGTLFVGPVVSQWYRLLEHTVRVPGASPTTQTLLRLVADQLVAAPTMLSIFFVYNSLSAGDSWQHAKATWREKFYPTIIANYKVWPAVNFINFRYVPLEHRLLVVNVISLVWNTYLAYVANGEPRGPDETKLSLPI